MGAAIAGFTSGDFVTTTSASGASLGALDHSQLDLRHTRSDHFNFPRRRQRQIDHSSIDERTSIGNSHLHFFSVVEIRHFHPGLKWKCAMCRSELLHVVDLARCSSSSVIRIAVPACESCLRLSDFRWSGLRSTGLRIFFRCRVRCRTRCRRASRLFVRATRRNRERTHDDRETRINRGSKH